MLEVGEHFFGLIESRRLNFLADANVRGTMSHLKSILRLINYEIGKSGVLVRNHTAHLTLGLFLNAIKPDVIGAQLMRWVSISFFCIICQL